MGPKKALVFDLGGTKLAAGIVSETGEIFHYTKEPARIPRGFDAVVDQFVTLGRRLLDTEEGQDAGRVGVASAGPLDPYKGLLLDPTNFFTNGKSWGVVDFVSPLCEGLGLPVVLENDAAAAVLAENWKGEAQGAKNCVAMTLGTGVGVGVVVNGELLRSGGYLHPEVSHMVIGHKDDLAPSPIGVLGTMEAYLSGKNFSQRVAKKWGLGELSGEELTSMAQNGESKALEAFSEYADWFAVSLYNLTILFAPEVIVIAGGFAAASDLFLNETKSKLSRMLQRRQCAEEFFPKVRVSNFKNQMGLIGAAHVAFHRA